MLNITDAIGQTAKGDFYTSDELKEQHNCSSMPCDNIYIARKDFTKEVDVEIVPEKFKKHLNQFQVQGVAKAILALEKYNGFLDASRAGTGKTRMLLVTAKYFADKGMKVLIVTENSIIWPKYATGKFWKESSYYKDSNLMGIRLKLTNGTEDGLLKGVVYLATYDSSKNLKHLVDKNTLVVADECQNWKNREKKARSWVSQHGEVILDNAGKVAYYSATPIDKLSQLEYLNRVLKPYLPFIKGSVGSYLNKNLGLIRGMRSRWVVPRGKEVECNDRLCALFNGLTKKGLMFTQGIRNKVTVSYNYVDVPEKAHTTMDIINEYLGGGLLDGIAEIENKVESLDIQINNLSRQGCNLRNGGKYAEANILRGKQDSLARERDNLNDKLTKLNIEKHDLGNNVNRAYILMRQRNFLEQYKVDYVVDQINKELKEKRKVVVFIYRVREGTIIQLPDGTELKSIPTIGLIKKKLLDSGICETSIAELHDEVPKSIKESAAHKFQYENAKIILVTVGCGGAGINLDDNVGDAPRTMIIVTADLSGVDDSQIKGRILRLNTKSESRIIYVIARGVYVDSWNMEIVDKKIKSIKATVEGNTDNIDDWDNEDGDRSLDCSDGLFGEHSTYTWEDYVEQSQKKNYNIDGVF